MPLQNRVTPFGDIVAIAQRGLFTGNRGIIHDPATKMLIRRRWTTRAWLICSCDFKGRRRTPMAGRSWTELFFLDEAVALAAGHRPCFLCRRAAAQRFQACWASSPAAPPPSARQMDAVLHRERIAQGRKRLHPLPLPPSALPDGAVVALAGHAYTICSGLAYRWTEDGYDHGEILRDADWLVTPPSTLRVLLAGYRPILHASIHPTQERPDNGRSA
jgi:hypothetical protein